MSNLEKFAKIIAARSLGIDAAVLDALLDPPAGDSAAGTAVAGYGIDIVSITTLIEAIMAAISTIMTNCPDKLNRQRLQASVSNPSRMQIVAARLQVGRQLPQNSRVPVRFTDVVAAMLQVGAEATAADVAAVADEVLALDNSI